MALRQLLYACRRDINAGRIREWPMRSAVSIVMPVLDEGAGLALALDRLEPARAAGVEVIVADGGSADSSVSTALTRCDQVVAAPRGRARQMNAGAAAASGAILLFLHADTRLPEGALEAVERAMADGRHAWGRFDVRIAGRSRLLPVVAAAMNLRSRWTGVATGDQAMFVRRDVFERIGGFPDIPLMEDIAISRRLKREGWPLCLRDRVTTSGRRWDERGALRTIATMWSLRAAFFLGADPARLARVYGYRPHEDRR